MITILTVAAETASCTIYGTIATGTPVSVQAWQGSVTSVRAVRQSYAVAGLGHSPSDFAVELFNAAWLSVVAALCLVFIVGIMRSW